MDKSNLNIEKLLYGDRKSAKDYLLLIRNNIKTIVFVAAIVVTVITVYAYSQKDIYSSTATVKITEPNQNVLDPNQGPRYDIDRFIANEIKIIQNFNTRKKIALALIDSFNVSENKNEFVLIKSGDEKISKAAKSPDHLAGLLGGVMSAEQVTGIDVITITAESPSPYEAALIANVSAQEYQNVNLAISRDKLTKIREFLQKQSEEKLAELKQAEDSLTKFQAQGGIVSMDVQSTGLISQLTQLDAQKQATQIELMTSNEVLKQYKFFLGKQDPKLVDYLENQTSQAYINALQQQLAELQVNRDLALSVKSPNVDVSAKIKEYDDRISDLQQKLSAAISSIKAEGFSGNPEQVRELAQRTIEEEIKNNTLSVKLEQLEAATRRYENNLRRLPSTSTRLSQYQRERESIQQLFLLLNERFQEAVINELSQSGNVIIIDPARVPDGPSKPNRRLMIMFGLLLGPAVGIGLILIRDFFDHTIKTPEDIEKNNINFLSWIPQYKPNGKQQDINKDLVVLYEPDSPVSESFRAIRARIQHSLDNNESKKVILITSPAENEGKTFVGLNLAGSYAQSNKKTLIVDCDLRRPRIHDIMTIDKKPGIADYLTNRIELDKIIRRTSNNNLYFITSGNLPSNPAEMLESSSMAGFLSIIKEYFDIVILDSAPIIAVIDAEILAKQVDGTLLVISSEKTEQKLMLDAVELLKRNNVSFLGTVLNNFQYKKGYGYYYKYYYNYSNSPKKKKRAV